MEDQTKIHENPVPALSAASYERFLVPLALLFGLAIRLYNASTTALNPDECWHAFFSWPPDWAIQSLQVHHPPLLFFLLHHLQAIHSAEVFLRLPALLAGTLFPWVFFQWLNRLNFPIAALAAFLLLEFSSIVISLSFQLRGYTLALLFTASALFFLEMALQRPSLPALSLFAVSLYLAILSEFSVAFAAAGLGVYALLRILSQPRSWTFSLAWAATQLGALGLYAYLYVTSISNLLGDPNAKGLIAGYLRDCFPMPGENPLSFACRATLRQFYLLASSAAIGALLAALFLIGLFVIWRAGLPGSKKSQLRPLLIAILAALALALFASLRLLHPYGRSRQTIILALFTVIPIALAIEWIFHRFPRLNPFAKPALAGCTVLLILVAPPPPFSPDLNRFSPADMRQAVQELESVIPKESILFVDEETAWILSHYWHRKTVLRSATPGSPFRMLSFNSYPAYTLRWDHISREIIAADVADLRRHENIPPTQPIYVLDTGFEKLPALTWNARDLSKSMLLILPE